MPDAAQERALVRYLRRDVRSYSPRYGVSLMATPVQRAADLARLPFTTLGEIEDTRAFVLRPTKETIAASGDFGLILRLWWASLWRRERALSDNVIDPAYKPVHWLEDAGILLGYTAEDLERLAEVGRLRLQSAGIEPDDVLVSLVPTGPTAAFWQLQLGARRGGVPALFLAGLPSAPTLTRLSPTVLAGGLSDLMASLEKVRAGTALLPSLRTLLVVGETISPTERSALLALGGEVNASDELAVVVMWAPPGLRSLWGECRAGDMLHTVPAVEFLELIDGEIVWTPIGWKGSVAIRLRTGVHAVVDDSRCPACGSDAPRVEVTEALPRFARVLDAEPAIAGWQVEQRTAGGADELIVYLATDVSGHPGALLRQLDAHIGATQYVVLDHGALSARLAAHDNRRIVDNRNDKGHG